MPGTSGLRNPHNQGDPLMPDWFFPSLKQAGWLVVLGCLFPNAVPAQPDAVVQQETHVPHDAPAQHDAPVPHDAPEPVVWRKAPLRILLQESEERLVHFPDSVRMALPQSLASALRAQSIHGTLYLRADEPFAATRVLVYTQPEGPIYVLDVEAVAAGAHALPDVEIVTQAPASEGGAGHSSPWGYVALSRFAAQTLHAPPRLVPREPGIVRVPVTSDPVALVQGPHVQATPVAAWKAGGYYVSAVQLTNLESRPVTLDPRKLCGRWLAATFQRNRLLPKGDALDTTTVYLVSDRPFDAAR